VLPHTLAVGLPDAFARRLARNTHAILLEESNLAKVTDPAAGSGAIEARTDSLCAAAWDLFREIEAAGGLMEALRQGLVHRRIEAAREQSLAQVASRKRPITGVSEFPDLSEKTVSVLETAPAELSGIAVPEPSLPAPGDGERLTALRKMALEGCHLLDLGMRLDKLPRDTSLPRLTTARLSEPFENLRDAAEELEDRMAISPKVFLASLGSVAQFTARASWAANAFAAGGLKPAGPAVHDSVDDLVRAFRDSGAVLACIVSTDEVYEDLAAEAAQALKGAGAQQVLLAGRPGTNEAAFAAAGIDGYLHAGCDLPALLREAHTKLQAFYTAELPDLEVQQ
jgi:methylmalonyl-CoA mutase